MPGNSRGFTLRRFIPAIAVMSAIFVFSSLPGDQLHPPKFLTYDKAWHLLEYGILAAAYLFALHPLPPDKPKAPIALGVIGFTALYGVSDELHQSFVPLRTASLADVLADTLGGVIVAGVWWWRERRKLR